MFSNAIVRKPCRNIINGITSSNFGKPDYGKAVDQHKAYVSALEESGLDVQVLPPDENYPDSVFIEDVALITTDCAIITRPGEISRRGEGQGVRSILQEYFTDIHEIVSPGTVEAGDIMMVGNHYYIGVSARTNMSGAEQVSEILNIYEMTSSIINLEKVLHLKTGMSYIENNDLLLYGEFLENPEFKNYNIIEVPRNESYAANCIWVNDTVLVPWGHPKTRQKIQDAGYKIIELNMSEFRKLDGGLSCLSLRF